MIGVLNKGCVCGHSHKTERGEPIDLCLECQCSSWTARCQNCGGEASTASFTKDDYSVCSRRCALQLEHAVSLQVKA